MKSNGIIMEKITALFIGHFKQKFSKEVQGRSVYLKR